METKGLHWPWAYERGLDPDAEVLDPLLKQHIDRVAADPVAILDVGAGPLTAVGKTHTDRTLAITATDALADEYDRVLAEAGVDPPIRTQLCRGEDLLERFGPERFDIAYARNSVDHSANPMRIIENMLAVVKTGGFVLLRHYQNEAEVERYEELHQWNFDIREGHLTLWNPRARHDVTAAVGTRATIEVGIETWSEHAPWVACAMRKTSRSTGSHSLGAALP